MWMNNPIYFLFYQIDSLFDKEYFFPGLNKLEYRAAAFLGFLLLLNIAVILSILGINIFNYDKLGFMSFIFVFEILFMRTYLFPCAEQ